MEKSPFLKWLLHNRGCTQKPAHDALSRCKRLEGTLAVPLDKAVSSQTAFNAALERVWRAHPGRNDLLYAMRLYAAFKNPRIDTRKHAFYGGLMRKEKAK
jgi:hypothetical protein